MNYQDGETALWILCVVVGIVFGYLLGSMFH